MTKKQACLGAIIAATLTCLSVPAGATAQAADCDVTAAGSALPPAYIPTIKFSEFQAVLDKTVDLNGDGKTTICLGDNVVVTNEGESIATLKVAKDNLAIRGSEAARATIKALPFAGAPYGPAIVQLMSARSFSLANVNFEVYINSARAIHINGGVAENIKNAHFKLQAPYSIGIDVSGMPYYVTSSLTLVDNCDFSLLPGLSTGYSSAAYGIKTNNAQIGSLTNLRFFGNTALPSPNDYALFVSNAKIGLIQNISVQGKSTRISFYDARVTRFAGVSSTLSGSYGWPLIAYYSAIGVIDGANLTGKSPSGLTDTSVGRIVNSTFTAVPDGSYHATAFSAYSNSAIGYIGKTKFLGGGGLALSSGSSIGAVRDSLVQAKSPYNYSIALYDSRIDLLSKSALQASNSRWVYKPELIAASENVTYQSN